MNKDAPVTLNGLEAALLKADNRGNLVAKFDLTELKKQLELGPVTLTLMGSTITGVEFTGSEEVRVIAPPRPQGAKQACPNPLPGQHRKAQRPQK